MTESKFSEIVERPIVEAMLKLSATDDMRAHIKILYELGGKIVANGEALVAALRASEPHPDAVAKAAEAKRGPPEAPPPRDDVTAGVVEAIAQEAERMAAGLLNGESYQWREDETKNSVCANILRQFATAIRARATSPSPRLDEDAEHAAFEEWVRLNGQPAGRYGAGYSSPIVDDCWSAWLASAQRRKV